MIDSIWLGLQVQYTDPCKIRFVFDDSQIGKIMFTARTNTGSFMPGYSGLNVVKTSCRGLGYRQYSSGLMHQIRVSTMKPCWNDLSHNCRLNLSNASWIGGYLLEVQMGHLTYSGVLSRRFIDLAHLYDIRHDISITLTGNNEEWFSIIR